MTFPQVVSIGTFAIGMAGLAWSILRSPQPAPEESAEATIAPSRATVPRRA
jgi:hypothetical protein